MIFIFVIILFTDEEVFYSRSILHELNNTTEMMVYFLSNYSYYFSNVIQLFMPSISFLLDLLFIALKTLTLLCFTPERMSAIC